MKRTALLTVLALATLFIISCKNQGTKGLPIPKDAAFVLHIDAASLSNKLSWKDIQQTQWFQETFKDTQDTLARQLMQDPDASGVDIKSDFVFFMKNQGRGSYMVFEGKLKNASSFENMINKMHKGENIKIQKDGDLSYVQREGEGHLLSWNSSKFVFIASESFSGMSRLHSPEGMESQRSKNTDSLKIFTRDLLALSRDNSMESNDHFKDLIAEKGDVHFWANAEQYYSQMQTAGSQNSLFSLMTKMNEMMKGNVATGTLSFDDGKISVKTKQYMSEQMKKIWDKYPNRNVTEDMINRVPSQNVVGVFAMNYPPDALKELMQAMGLDGLVNGFLGKVNYSLDELVQATKGQVIVAATDFTYTNKPQTYSGPNGNTTINIPSPDIKYLLAVSVKNKPSFDKLIGIAESQIGDSNQRNALLSKVSFQTSNDWFALSNSSQAVNQFLAGGQNKLPFASRISGHPFGAYIDIQKLLQGFKGLPMMGGNPGLFDLSMNVWQDVVMTGGDYKNGTTTGEATINFVDKQTNSLKQINQYIEKMYEQKKKREANMMTNPGMDSTIPVITLPGEK